MSSTNSSVKSVKKQPANEDEFTRACLQVFQQHDTDKNGVLDKEEFKKVLNSKTLSLNLSEDESAEVRKEIEESESVKQKGGVSYEEFIPVIRQLLKDVYAKKEGRLERLVHDERFIT